MDASRLLSIRTSIAALALLLVCAAAAAAADTGTISGTIFSQSGEAVTGATVTLSGELVPGGRSVVTGETGAYRFDFLLPGEYRIEVTASGMPALNRPAFVELGRATQVDLVVGVAVTEAITVTAARPIVDVRSTEVAFNYAADTINALPLERTYRGLFQLIPGVADNRSSVGPAAGGSRQDNTYLIDGANITNPSFGYLSTEINELDVAEVNLKRAGVSAEFGRAAGTVTNVVSRSGSNRMSGIARMDWLPESLVADYTLPSELTDRGVRPGTFRDTLLTTESSPAMGIGGPLVRDHVFFYGSARYAREDKWNRFNKVGGALPDEERTVHEYFGKVTAIPSPQHQLNVSYRHRPNHVDNASLDSNTSASVATNTDNSSDIASADWTTFLTPRSSVNVRYLFTTEKNEDMPVVNLGYLPPFNAANPAAVGQYTDSAQADLRIGGFQYANVQNYQHQEFRATFSRFLDIKRSSHSIKAGGGFERGQETLNRVTNGWGLIQSLTQNNAPVLRARYYSTQPPQVGQGNTTSLFVQDEMTLGPRLSVTAGVLLNRDGFAQRVDGSGGCPSTVTLKGGAAVYESDGDTCTFLRFGFGDEIQPRIGGSYSLRAGKGDKAYANWGRYYNMDQKSAGRSLAPSRIYQTQTIFSLSGAVLSSGPLVSTTGKMIDPDIQPIYSDEIVVGYATPIAERYGLDVFFVQRSMHNFIEDLPSRLSGTAPDAGPFVAANLPCTRFAACQLANAKRTYRGVTIDFRRRLADKWTTDTSYTWSRFEGNFDLDYATAAVFNTSSFIQDGPGTNVEDPNRFGPLNEDRTHIAKLMATYTPTSRWTTSGYLRVQSGTPWNARARDWPGAVMNYLEPAGAHRNPTWTNLDLMASYRLPLNARTSLSLEGRVLNVFNNQTQLSTDPQKYLDLTKTDTPPYFGPYTQPNPFFGLGNGFAPPRRLYLAAVLTF
jgi:hypothetical protein